MSYFCTVLLCVFNLCKFCNFYVPRLGDTGFFRLQGIKVCIVKAIVSGVFEENFNFGPSLLKF